MTSRLNPFAPTAFHAAEAIIEDCRAAGMSPARTAETMIAVLFLMNKANSIDDNAAMTMFAQTYAQFLRAKPVLPSIVVKS